MKSLFLQAPSFDGYDGGAGARYQMKREVQRFWYPTWLAQPAAMVDGSRLIDAPPHDLSFKDIEDDVKAHELIVLHTSDPQLQVRREDRRADQGHQSHRQNRFHRRQGGGRAGEEHVRPARRIDFVARNEFDFTIKEIADGRDWADHQGHHLSQRRRRRSSTIADREILDEHGRAAVRDCRSISAISTIKKYFGGYLKHPYISFYTGRGCKSRCTFCLWPQTVGGHNYRFRSIDHVIEEVKYVREAFPQVQGNLLRRRHPDRQPAARRRHSPRSWASWARPGPATPRPTCRARRWR